MTSIRSDSELIEYIVAEVIRRLTASGAVVVSRGNKDTPATLPNRDLRLDERLITLASLDGRLVGVSRVVVPARAVVTPAAGDELKRRRITLQRD